MKKEKEFIVRVRGIIIHEGKLLVVKHPHDTSFCALPGRHLEWGEDIKECLHREIVEELGVDPIIGKLLYINNFIDGDIRQSIEFFFEILNGDEYLNTEKLARSHAHEIAEIVWLSPTDNIRILPKGLDNDFKTGKIVSDEIKYIKD